MLPVSDGKKSSVHELTSYMLCLESNATEEDKWEGKNGRRWGVLR